MEQKLTVLIVPDKDADGLSGMSTLFIDAPLPS